MNTKPAKKRTRTGGNTKQKYRAFLAALKASKGTLTYSDINNLSSVYGITKRFIKYMIDLRFIERVERSEYRVIVQALDNLDVAANNIYKHQLILNRMENKKRHGAVKKEKQLAISSKEIFYPELPLQANAPAAQLPLMPHRQAIIDKIKASQTKKEDVHSIDSFVETLSDGTLISALIKRGYIILKDASK